MQKLSDKLLKIQKSLGAVTKGSKNPHFRSTYADLNEVYELAKPALNSEDILLFHRSGKDPHGSYITTELVSGDQVLESRVYLSGSEDNMQKVGAAYTYAKRQGLKALLALEEVDDDGEIAVGRGGSSGSNGKAGVGSQGAQAVKAAPMAKEERSELGAKEVSTKDREALNALIRQTGKVLADMKKQPLEETAKLVKSHGVTKTEELTDEQAKEVYEQLKGKLK